MTICYKVVTQYRRRMYSAVALGKKRLHYKLDVQTNPVFGKLFVFADFHSALRFSHNSETILECECPELEPGRKAPSVEFSVLILKKWWKGESMPDYELFLPDGTRFTDWVIPKKIMERPQ